MHFSLPNSTHAPLAKFDPWIHRQDGSGSHLVTRRILQGWAVGPAPWRRSLETPGR